MITLGKKLSSVMLVAAMASSAYAASNIASTKHNLSATWGGAGIDSRTIKAADGDSNNEICVYCHTPHAGNTAFTGAPLWNKKNASSTGFTMYGATGVDTNGTTIAGTKTASAPQNPSMACLSCHDGASAINSMVNAPGSGVWGAGDTGQTTNQKFGATPAGTAFLMTSTLVANIGKDLTNDHPISIAYTDTNGTAANNPAGLKVRTTTLTGWAGAKTIASLLRNNNVECGSCHDPHEKDNATFLRTANAGSALCLGCHEK